MLNFMNSKVVEKQSKERSCPDQSKKDKYEIWYITSSYLLEACRGVQNIQLTEPNY